MISSFSSNFLSDDIFTPILTFPRQGERKHFILSHSTTLSTSFYLSLLWSKASSFLLPLKRKYPPPLCYTPFPFYGEIPLSILSPLTGKHHLLFPSPSHGEAPSPFSLPLSRGSPLSLSPPPPTGEGQGGGVSHQPGTLLFISFLGGGAGVRE